MKNFTKMTLFIWCSILSCALTISIEAMQPTIVSGVPIFDNVLRASAFAHFDKREPKTLTQINTNRRKALRANRQKALRAKMSRAQRNQLDKELADYVPAAYVPADEVMAKTKALLDQGANPNYISLDSTHEPRLSYACIQKNYPLAQLFLDYGADINQRNKGGGCVLHLLHHEASKPMSSEDKAIIQRLISRQNINMVDDDNCMPLSRLFIQYANPSSILIQMLLDAKADTNFKEIVDRTPNCSPEIIDMLIKAGYKNDLDTPAVAARIEALASQYNSTQIIPVQDYISDKNVCGIIAEYANFFHDACKAEADERKALSEEAAKAAKEYRSKLSRYVLQ